jgi:hypothetical protein
MLHDQGNENKKQRSFVYSTERNCAGIRFVGLKTSGRNFTMTYLL